MKIFPSLTYRALRRAALAAFGLAFLGGSAVAEAPGAANGSSYWTEPSGAIAQQRMTPADHLAKPLGELQLDATAEPVHRRWRRGLFIRPGYYRRGWHGRRYRYSRGPFRYRYHGWWYRRPWWIVDSYHPRYPRRAYYYQRYAVPSGGRCNYWARQCGRNWGYRNPDFYGCMRYHRCR